MDIVKHLNDKHPLVGISGFVGVLKNIEQVSLFDMEHHLLETDPSSPLELAVLVAIPVILDHLRSVAQCVPIGNTPPPPNSRDPTDRRSASGQKKHSQSLSKMRQSWSRKVGWALPTNVVLQPLSGGQCPPYLLPFCRLNAHSRFHAKTQPTNCSKHRQTKRRASERTPSCVLLAQNPCAKLQNPNS